MTPTRAIPVAPREIVDLVNRILRVAGVDAGSAAELATGVMQCAADGQPAIAHVLSRIDDGSIGSLVLPHQPHEQNAQKRHDSLRNGITVHEAEFRALERAAAKFLVAESTLDAVADEATVD